MSVIQKREAKGGDVIGFKEIRKHERKLLFLQNHTFFSIPKKILHFQIQLDKYLRFRFLNNASVTSFLFIASILLIPCSSSRVIVTDVSVDYKKESDVLQDDRANLNKSVHHYHLPRLYFLTLAPLITLLKRTTQKADAIDLKIYNVTRAQRNLDRLVFSITVDW